jgi:hypothetical protein
MTTYTPPDTHSSNEKIDYDIIISEMQKAKSHIDLIMRDFQYQREIKLLKDELNKVQNRYEALVESHNTMHHLNNQIKAEMDLRKIQQETLILELQTQLAKRNIQ